MGRVGRQAAPQPGRLFGLARLVLCDRRPDAGRGCRRAIRGALPVLAAPRGIVDAAPAGARGGGGRRGGGGPGGGSAVCGVVFPSPEPPPPAAAPAPAPPAPRA